MGRIVRGCQIGYSEVPRMSLCRRMEEFVDAGVQCAPIGFVVWDSVEDTVIMSSAYDEPE